MINYRILLKKYMSHVLDCDGTTFIEYVGHEGHLKPRDLEELKRIKTEILRQGDDQNRVDS